MFGNRRAEWLVSISLALALFGCGRAPTVYDTCKADPMSQCCLDSECGSTQACDYDFSCGVVGSGDVVCGGGTGTRRCVDRCDSKTACSVPGTTCQQRVHFQGGDAGWPVMACFPTP